MSEKEESRPGMSRREFFKGSAVAVVGVATAGVLAGCGKGKDASAPATDGKDAAAKKVNFRVTPPPIPAKDIKETFTADVVVVGAGMAGMCAAVSAAQSGAKVILLEKTGKTNYRGMDIGMIGSRAQKSVGNNLDRDEVITEIMRTGGYRGDQRVVRLWAANSGACFDWLEDMAKEYGIGVAPVPVEEQDLHQAGFKYYTTGAAFFVPNDEAMKDTPKLADPSQMAVRYVLLKAANKAGVDIHFNTPAAQLVREGKGKVTGVIAKTEEGAYIKINANKGVILCAGDYGGDKDMLEELIPTSKYMYGNAYPGDFNTGDGHKMGLWVGAAMDEEPHVPNYFDIGLEGRPAGYKPVPLTRQPWLNVNLRGERYGNEDLPYSYICNDDRQQPGKGMKWVIWDSKWQDEVARFKMISCKAMRPPLHDPKEVEALIAEGVIKSANTIEELIQKMGVPADTCKATIARYNELAKAGKDLDFGKRSEVLTTIEKAPFYAAKLGACLLVALGGLRVNDKLQVLDTEDNPIPGLYAAGNNSGSFFAVDYPMTTHGLTHGRAITFGYLAAKNAVALG